MGFEKIDLNNIEPEIIKDSSELDHKPNSSKKVLYSRAELEINESGIDFVYLIFSFEKVCSEYGIDYDDCLVILYLYELGVFSSLIEVYGSKIRLTDFLSRGLIKNDSNYKEKKRYSLTKVSIDIVGKIMSFDKSRIVGENRLTDLSTSLKIKSAFTSYFDS